MVGRKVAKRGEVRLTAVQRAAIVVAYARCMNGGKVQRIMKKNHNIDICDKTPKRLYDRFVEEGWNVQDIERPGRPRTSRTEVAKESIKESIKESPWLSVRKRAQELGISRATMWRAFDEMQIKHFRPRMAQMLTEGDKLNRMQFGEWMLEKFQEDEDLWMKIVMTDECIVRLRGAWNTHNMVWYGVEKPPDEELMMEMKTCNRKTVHVWAGVCAAGITGPFLFKVR